MGILFAFCTGYTKDLVWISILNGLTPLVFGIILFFMPESPFYYIMKEKGEEAQKALQKFRGKDYDCEAEIQEFQVRNQFFTSFINFLQIFSNKQLLVIN